MKPRYQGSLLHQIATVHKATKRNRAGKFENDDFPTTEDTNITLRENIRSKISNSLSSFDDGKAQEGQVKSDTIKRDSKVLSSSDESQDNWNANSFNSADREKSQSNLALKAEKRAEPANKSNAKSMLLGPSSSNKKLNEDIYPSYGGNRTNVPQAGFSGIPKASRFPKPRSTSNTTTHDLLSKKSENVNQDELNQKYNQSLEVSTDQTSVGKSIQNEDLVKKMSEPIRRRLVVNLPTADFEARRVQVTTALDMAEQDVDEISDNVKQIHDSLIQLSRDSRGISEKSMDLTQTAEAVLSKVNVMADWIDGLGKVGSGLKIQLIEWIVKFVSFLSSLLLLLYQTIRKANPLALLRKKGKKKEPLKEVVDDENS